MTEPKRETLGIKTFTTADGGQTAVQERTRQAAVTSNIQRPREEPTTFSPAYPGLPDSLPARTALLCVTAEGSHFKLHWFLNGESDESRPEEIAVQSAPKATMSEILRTKEWKRAYKELRAWWCDFMRLIGWMDGLLGDQDQHGPLRLVVWDNTGFQIPWEAVYLDPSDRWVGAEVEVIRWTSIKDIGRVASYTAVPATCTGGVLALESADIFDPDGRPLLDEPLARYGATAKRRMWQLLTALDSTRSRFGLVLVRCHGIYGDSMSDFELAEMTMVDVEEFRMSALATFPALVFLNACDTASPARPGPHSFVATRTFAELFLRRGANSVLATLGQVDLDHSHDFAARLLAAEDVQQRLAALLREHRSKAVDRVRPRADDEEADSRNDQDFERFFQSFAYVYFGHPDTVLHLTATSNEPSA
ncbi:CHAT domain-containing protein [Catellatospora coxensis]|uniref:CHAT domain-containing protein n=1 Tax=Catellatospora coxensis TaxID=310354 RepID=A0A8J3KYL1_9ACTN|nr:CHAT domain-containing protein [Catellatospora coxensis]GIG05436.1 hypothetical protein Cco03nite_21360 [Catellatospora coxensis]